MDRVADILGGIWSFIEGIYWPNPNPEDSVSYFLSGVVWLTGTVAAIVVVVMLAVWILKIRHRRSKSDAGAVGETQISRRSDR